MTTTFIFDLETKRLAQEVGGWDHIDRLGLAAAVLLDIEKDEFLLYTEDDAEALIDDIVKADRIVGFNVVRFDYAVLRPYGLAINVPLVSKTTDLLHDIYHSLGFRVSLDNLAEASLNKAKSADGIQAVAWYKQGKIDKVLAYCQQDVVVTNELWEYGKRHGFVNFRDNRGHIQAVSVQWS